MKYSANKRNGVIRTNVIYGNQPYRDKQGLNQHEKVYQAILRRLLIDGKFVSVSDQN